MKNRYGTSMIYGHILPGSSRIARIPQLSKDAKERLRWLDYYATHQQNARLTCRHFGLSPDVFYRWKRRFNSGDLSTLEDDRRTRRPKRVRQPLADPTVVLRVKQLRELYPRWGKKKLWKLLEREGINISVSTVGRTLDRLRAKGRLIEPPAVLRVLAKRKRKRTGKRPHAIRKPWHYTPKQPGDLIEIDTVYVYPLPGKKRFQFTAQDVITKQTIRRAATTMTATNASHILDVLQTELPRQPKAIQIDGGSEFKSIFETKCQQLGIALFVLPPRSPRLNGVVERMQRTSREEIYDIIDVPLDLDEHNLLLQEQDHIYNSIRPHDSLALMTPNEYYANITTSN